MLGLALAGALNVRKGAFGGPVLPPALEGFDDYCPAQDRSWFADEIVSILGHHGLQAVDSRPDQEPCSLGHALDDILDALSWADIYPCGSGACGQEWRTTEKDTNNAYYNHAYGISPAQEHV
jgi:hypothetical protein